MDGNARALDNVFVERLWRMMKYEEVYLHEYATGVECHAGLTSYLRFYCEERGGLAVALIGHHLVIAIPGRCFGLGIFRPGPRFDLLLGNLDEPAPVMSTIATRERLRMTRH